ncbi:Calcium dependent protein kinase [Quillaja saponaria]|uniref:non-specific serine/threonine protein kinase n=1 Tax=Quillaja saponaria TaxID=32244 RepID=A0AAD7Q7K8_QUISA|nr:Calcium dependent protein kinase [Quillaja saponaria]
MGNNCVGSRTSNERLLDSISNSIWGTQSSRGLITNTSIGVFSGSPSLTKDSDVPFHIQSRPPEQVKIVMEDIKTVQPTRLKVEIKQAQQQKQDKETKSSEPTRHMEETRLPESTCHQEETRPASTTRQKKESKPEQPARLKKPHSAKRLSSAGLQAESVLQTKTGHLEEYYNLGRNLGQGRIGTSFLCVEKATGKEYACKSIAKWKLLTNEDVEDVRREIQIIHHLAGNPNVVSIKGAYEDAVSVHVILELCAGGKLFDRIVKRRHYTERKAAELARTIVGVVEACQSLGVMHRDLKPENFLFVNEEEDSPLRTIDFGMSVFFKPGEIFSDVVGSSYYVAPEVLHRRYGPEADVWSAGVIIYILLCGMPPFWAGSKEDIHEQVLHGNLHFSSDPWHHVSESAKDLVRKMLVRDPRKRITAHEVLCHPWVQVDGAAPE